MLLNEFGRIIIELEGLNFSPYFLLGSKLLKNYAILSLCFKKYCFNLTRALYQSLHCKTVEKVNFHYYSYYDYFLG